eukprot:717637-Amphidinium_carterae.1
MLGVNNIALESETIVHISAPLNTASRAAIILSQCSAAVGANSLRKDRLGKSSPLGTEILTSSYEQHHRGL